MWHARTGRGWRDAVAVAAGVHDTDPPRIDGAFADRDGRTYLFSGDQYIRYSGTEYTVVDKGYPRPVAEWHEREGLGTPAAGPLDALQAPDGTIHVLTRTGGWGRVRTNFENLDRIDAAYAGDSTVGDPDAQGAVAVGRRPDLVAGADEFDHRLTGAAGGFDVVRGEYCPLDPVAASVDQFVDRSLAVRVDFAVDGGGTRWGLSIGLPTGGTTTVDRSRPRHPRERPPQIPYELARAHHERGRHLTPRQRSPLGLDRTAHLRSPATAPHTVAPSLRRVQALARQPTR